MNYNQKLTSILEHWLLTNKEIEEPNGDIISGVTTSDVETMIKELQPVKDEDYKKLLEDTLLTLDDHVYDLMGDLSKGETGEYHDITIIYGNHMSRLPLNADLYSGITMTLNEQIQD